MRILQSKWLSITGICMLFMLPALLFLPWHGASVNAAPPGNWKISPSPSGPYTIYGISASGISMWAVGAKNNSSPSTTRTFTEGWDGTKWSVIPSANYGKGFYNILEGVSSFTSLVAWAVGGHGYDNNPLHVATLIEYWDGKSWTIVPSAPISSAYSNLTAVMIRSTIDVWAVGSYRTSQGDRTLTEHWDGKTWSQVASPGYADLTSITIISDLDIWAAGTSAQNGQAMMPFLMHWDGTSWSIVSPAHPKGIQSGTFTSISSSFASYPVWAVGSYWDGTNTYFLTEVWDGHHWSVIPAPGSIRGHIPAHIASASSIPQSGGPYHQLNSVTVIDRVNVWSAGASTDNNGVIQTYTLYWNGIKWHVITSPNLPNEPNILMGITYVAGHKLRQPWAAGFALNSQGVATPLIMVYS